MTESNPSWERRALNNNDNKLYADILCEKCQQFYYTTLNIKYFFYMTNSSFPHLISLLLIITYFTVTLYI